jgi:uncharacterized protein (DUF2141 family)
MKQLLLAIGLLMGPVLARSQDNKLTIEIDGNLQEGKTVHVALYRKEDHFPSEKTAFRTASVVVKGKSMKVQFDLPYGDYAAAIYLDENGNNALDKNGIGFPKEPFGFSNNFRPKLGKPKFKNCEFTFNADAIQTAINLRGG